MLDAIKHVVGDNFVVLPGAQTGLTFDVHKNLSWLLG